MFSRTPAPRNRRGTSTRSGSRRKRMQTPASTSARSRRVATEPRRTYTKSTPHASSSAKRTRRGNTPYRGGQSTPFSSSATPRKVSAPSPAFSAITPASTPPWRSSSASASGLASPGLSAHLPYEEILQDTAEHRVTSYSAFPAGVMHALQDVVQQHVVTDEEPELTARVDSKGWVVLAVVPHPSSAPSATSSSSSSSSSQTGSFMVWQGAQTKRTPVAKFPLAATEGYAASPVLRRVVVLTREKQLLGVAYVECGGAVAVRWYTEDDEPRIVRKQLPLSTGDYVTSVGEITTNSNEEHLLVCGTFGGSSFGLSLRFESSAMGSASTTLTSPVAASRHARSTSATGISEQLSINVFVVARSSSDQGDNQGANGCGGRFGLLSGLASSVGGVLGLSGWGGGSQASAKPQAIPHMRRSLLSRKVRASTVTGIVSVPPPDDAQFSLALLLCGNHIRLVRIPPEDDNGHREACKTVWINPLESLLSTAQSAHSEDDSKGSQKVEHPVVHFLDAFLLPGDTLRLAVLAAVAPASSGGSFASLADDDSFDEDEPANVQFCGGVFQVTQADQELCSLRELSSCVLQRQAVPVPRVLACRALLVEHYGLTFFAPTVSEAGLVIAFAHLRSGSLQTQFASLPFPHSQALGTGAVFASASHSGSDAFTVVAIPQGIIKITSKLHLRNTVDEDDVDMSVAEDVPQSTPARPRQRASAPSTPYAPPQDEKTDDVAAAELDLPDLSGGVSTLEEAVQVLQAAIQAHIRGDAIEAMRLAVALVQSTVDVGEASLCFSQQLMDAKPFTGNKRTRSMDTASAISTLQRKQQQFSQFTSFLRSCNPMKQGSLWSQLSYTMKQRILELGEKCVAARELAEHLGADVSDKTAAYLQARSQLLLKTLQVSCHSRGDDALLQDGMALQDAFFARVSRIEQSITVLHELLGPLFADEPRDAQALQVRELAVLVMNEVIEAVLSAAAQARAAQQRWLSLSTFGGSASAAPVDRPPWTFSLIKPLREHLHRVLAVLKRPSPQCQPHKPVLRQSVARIGGEFILREYTDHISLMQHSARAQGGDSGSVASPHQTHYLADRATVVALLTEVFRAENVPAFDENKVHPLLEVAFKFAKSSQYFLGLVGLCDLLPARARKSRLESYLNMYGRSFASPLFEEYQSQNRAEELLSLDGPPEYSTWLSAFLEHNPGLKWHYDIQREQFASAAHNLTRVVPRQTMLLDARRLTSLSKLAWLADGTDPPNQAALDDIDMALWLYEVQAKLHHYQLEDAAVLTPQQLFGQLLDYRYAPRGDSKQNRLDVTGPVWDVPDPSYLDKPFWNLADATRVLERVVAPRLQDTSPDVMQKEYERLWRAVLAADHDGLRDCKAKHRNDPGHQWAAGVAEMALYNVTALVLKEFAGSFDAHQAAMQAVVPPELAVIARQVAELAAR